MKVRFYTFAKKENSTEIPNTAYAEYEVFLKEGTSLLNPILKMDLGLATAPIMYNYCYIPSFRRYYFLSGRGWTFENRCWYGEFTVDALASWKSEIGATNSYVLRSASSSDGYIMDSMYPIKTNIQTDLSYQSVTGLTNVLSSGSFVVGMLTGDSGANFGSVSYYAFDAASFATFITALMGDSAFQVQDISDALYKSIFNPFQYIVSCIWLPVSISDVPTSSVSVVKFGWWTIATTANLVSTDSRIYLSGSLSRPDHPQAASRGKYLNAEPYTSILFQLMPFGSFNLTNVPVDAASIGFEILLDAITGAATLSVQTTIDNNSVVLAKVNAQLGCQLMIGEKNNNVAGGISGVLSGGLSAIGGFASGNIPMGVAGTLSAIVSMIEPARASVQSHGGISGVATTGIVAELYLTYKEVTDDAPAERGKPLCKHVQISTLSGFILCADADPAIACSEPELSAIRSYMNGGFFYD